MTVYSVRTETTEMSIFNIFAKLSLNTSHFESGMKRAESSAVALGRTLGRYFTAGTLGVGFATMSRQAVLAAVEIGNLAEQFGISTTQVQELQAAAESTGVSFQTLASAIDKVRQAKESALGGDVKSQDLLKRLGVSSNSDPFQIVKQLGHAKDLNAVYELLGSKSERIMSALRSIHELSPIELIDEHQVRRLREADAALGRIQRIIKAMTAGFIADRFNEADLAEVFGKMMLKYRFGIGGKPPSLPPSEEPDDIGIPQPGYQSTVDSLNARNQRERELSLEEKKKRIKEARERIMNAPLNMPAFQSSSQNNLAPIGGFFVGADRTAVQDIQKQNLQYTKIMAERMDRLLKEIQAIREGN